MTRARIAGGRITAGALAMAMASLAQAGDTAAPGRPGEGLWQGQLGRQIVFLCVESEQVRYRYVGRPQSLALTLGATGWSESVAGAVTGRWQVSRLDGDSLRGTWTDPGGKRRLPVDLQRVSRNPQACEQRDYLQDAQTESATPMPPLRLAACSRQAPEGGCLSAAADAAAVIRPDRSLWTWGPETRRVPVRQGSDFVRLHLGAYHRVGLKADGSLWAWGSNEGGQLGGDAVNGEAPVKLGDGFVDAGAGERHSFGLKRDGTVWAWGGAPRQGKFSDGSPYRKDKPFVVARSVVALSASGENVAVVKSDGSLWTTFGARDRAVEEGLMLVFNGDGYRQVSVGYSHIAALKTDGSLWTWGSNRWGQLGVGGPADERSEPARVGEGFAQVSAGLMYTAAIKTDGSLWAWGGGSRPRALFGDCNPETHPTPVKLAEGFTEVAMGEDFLVATQPDGSTWTWGWAWDDAQVELAEACRKPVRVAFGDGINRWDAPARAIEFPAVAAPKVGIISMATGPTHSAAVTADGVLWTWGGNANGQLGDGTVTARRTPVQVGSGYRSVSIDREATFAQKTDGSLWRFGLFSETLTQAQLAAARREGKIAPARVVDGIVQVMRYGRDRAMGLRADGTLVDWGYHWDVTRQPGQPMGRQVKAITASGWAAGGGALREDGSAWFLGHYFGAVPRLAGLDFIRFVMAERQVFGIRRDGSLWALGDNSAGELGTGSTTSAQGFVKIGTEFRDIAAGEAHVLALKRDGSLWAWGRNAAGAVGDGSTLNRAVPVHIGSGFVQIAAAGDHSLALKADGSLWAWGGNDTGAVGIGGPLRQLQPVRVALPPGAP